MRSRWPLVLTLLLAAPYAIYASFDRLGPAHVFATVTGVILLAALAAIFFSVRGALAGPDEAPLELGTDGAERAALLDEKNVLLRALKDIENEHALGKLSDEDRARLEADYRARARDVLARLDRDLGSYLDKARALTGEVAPRGRAYESAHTGASATQSAAPSDEAASLAAKLAALPEDKRKEAEAYLAQLAADGSNGDEG
jgi:hypothetical protein